MRTIGQTIKLLDIKLENAVVVDTWFDSVTRRWKMYSGTADPTTAVVEKGEWFLYKNTTLNEVRVWVNDNGTMKKSAAFV